MKPRLHRTQILLEPEQHRTLAEIARREGRSVSDLVREIVRQHLAQSEQMATADLKRRLVALERIREHRAELLERRGGKPLELDVVALIGQMREERDERKLAGPNDRG